MAQILTIDTGGTKTRLVKFADGTIEHEVEFPTPKNSDEYIAIVSQMIRTNFPKILESPEENVVSLATRGVISYGIVNDDLLDWHDFPLAKVLGEQLGCSVLVNNDAKMGGVGAFGADFRGRGLYVAIGTGIGVGMVIDGKLSHDLSGMEAGKMRLLRPDGQFASWESFASGKAFFEKYGKFGDEIPAGDPIWRAFAEDLVVGLYVLLPTLRPDKVIIGGAISEFCGKFVDILGDKLANIAQDGHYSFTPDIAAVANYHLAVNRGAQIFAEQWLTTRGQ